MAKHSRRRIAEVLNAAMGRISYEMDNPSPISQEDLYQKVRTAAKASLDIQVDFLEWSRGFVTTWSTDGCAAEPQHLQD